jgi:hypothetical protein
MTTNTLLATDEPQWAAALFDGHSGGLGRDAYRFGSGLALAAVFGLAVGVRSGLPDMAAHAAGVPVAMVAVALFGVPAFYVGLAHVGVDVDPRGLATATGMGTAMAGLVMAGLSPAMLLFSMTSESRSSIVLATAAGLATGSALGLRTMLRQLSHLDQAKDLPARLLGACFTLFVAVLAARVWAWSLPIFERVR